MLPPGTRYERYEVLHALGQGGMAWVYAARHTVLGTRHALKVLAVQRDRDRFVAEARLQARLDPRLVVAVTDVVESGGALALVMPLVEGCSLAALLALQRPTEPEAVAVILGVLSGVEAAHDADVIHRDLKPQNILLEVESGRVVVRVADFGIAKHLEDGEPRTVAGAFLGTPAYAAPEQQADASSVDARADLWSIGVILHRLLVGALPPPRGDATSPHLEALPERWRPVLGALLAPDPAGRPNSVADARARILAVGVSPAPLAHTGPIAEAVERAWTRHRTDALEVARVQSAETVLPTHISEGTARPAQVQEHDAFVGRGADLQAIREHLDGGVRLLAVVGMGGAGKTRLVAHYVGQSRAGWPGGVWWCDLSEARDVDEVASALGRTLGVPLGTGDAVELLGWALEGRGRCLVVLDNAEQVADVLPQTLGAWRDATDLAVFVVTSRQVPALPGEVVHSLDSLPTDDAVELFLLRASALDHTLDTADPELRQTVGELVGLLDGLPLAIELAAARARVLGPVGLVQRISDRFRLLVSQGSRTERQSTLRATLDWSWELLDRWERLALAQLSVFQGELDLDAAEAVLRLPADAPWPLDVLHGLVDHSLVRPLGGGRFELLASVQAYAAESLEDAAPVRARHAVWYATRGTDEALYALATESGQRRFRVLVRELPNLTAACRVAAACGDDAVAAATARAAWRVYGQLGPWSTGMQLLQLAVELKPSVALHLDRSEGAALRGDCLGALAEVDAAHLLAADDPALMARVLHRRGVVLAALGRTGEAEDAQREALERLRDQGRRHDVASALNHLGTLARAGGRRAEAEARYLEALRLARALGASRQQALVLGNLGLLSNDLGRLDEAERHLEAAVALDERAGRTRSMGIGLGNLALVARKRGEPVVCLRHLADAMQAHRQVGDRRMVARTLIGTGALHAQRGHLEDAAETLEQVLEHEGVAETERARAMTALASVREQQGYLEQARRLLETALDIQTRLGRHRQIGIVNVELALIAHREGRAQDADDRLHAALAAARPLGDRDLEGTALGNLGVFALRRGEWAIARTHLGAAREVLHDNRVWLGLTDVHLAEVSLEEGNLEAAMSGLDSAARSLDGTEATAVLGELWCVRARVAHAEGDAAAVRAALAHAECASAQLGSRSPLAARVAQVAAALR